MALPERQSTLLESPALAMMYFLGVIKTTLAVHPVWLETCSPSPEPLFSFSSFLPG
jgi:hypothetical protein